MRSPRPTPHETGDPPLARQDFPATRARRQPGQARARVHQETLEGGRNVDDSKNHARLDHRYGKRNDRTPAAPDYPALGNPQHSNHPALNPDQPMAQGSWRAPFYGHRHPWRPWPLFPATGSLSARRSRSASPPPHQTRARNPRRFSLARPRHRRPAHTPQRNCSLGTYHRRGLRRGRRWYGRSLLRPDTLWPPALPLASAVHPGCPTEFCFLRQSVWHDLEQRPRTLW